MKNYNFNSEDLARLSKKGISVSDIEIQLGNFRKGFPPMDLVAPATDGDGIICLSDEAIARYADHFKKAQSNLKTIKFVPASGAASRMFKSLFEYLEGTSAGKEADLQNKEIKDFIVGLQRLALYEDLEKCFTEKGENLKLLLSDGKYKEIIGTLLNEYGLNYGNLPKGLLQFHKYPGECRTAIEEHLVEGAEYCRGEEGVVNLHFTVSSEHLDQFIDLIAEKQPVYEERYGVRYNIEFSLQRAFTDIIAVDPGNKPFRDSDGSLLFRPGGHGALLANLNEMDADLVFIKNIDNVCPDRMKPVTYLYKRALAGLLIETRDKVFEYLGQLKAGKFEQLKNAEFFLENNLGFRLSETAKTLKDPEKAELIRTKLSRPVRVCGMVRNEGEPGGGPFWTRSRDGSVTLQIVESSQIDFKDKFQFSIAEMSTHFNPVDLICATRDNQGNPFDLNRFTDPDTGLISSKSKDGKSLKAQELPGLWNGSMSDWNTLFVDVPIETFNPVKTINDLLRSQHIA